jgi:hypothetical protein
MTDNLSPEQVLTPAQFADKIGRSTRHLRDLDKKKIFIARRTVTNEPYYLPEDVLTYFQHNPKQATA